MRRSSLRKGRFKSLLEAGVSESLTKRLGHPPAYEPRSLPYSIEAKYTPDFELPSGIYLETKGYFPSEDRRKMLAVVRSNPDEDIRICLSNPNAKISKGSKTTLAMWCDKHGIKWCTPSTIPEEWLHARDGVRKRARTKADTTS